MLSDKEKEEIREHAKTLLEKFGKELEKVPEAKRKKEVSQAYREEGKGNGSDPDFRKRMFDNAPNKDEDCIIAEKGSWN